MRLPREGRAGGMGAGALCARVGRVISPGFAGRRGGDGREGAHRPRLVSAKTASLLAALPGSAHPRREGKALAGILIERPRTGRGMIGQAGALPQEPIREG